MMQLPEVVTDWPVEPFAHTAPWECAPVLRPGVVAFAEWVRDHLGGGNSGYVRDCAIGSHSDHHAGRAWDWGVLATKPEDVEKVDALVGWLTSNGAENFRRVGLTYFIWNRQHWSGKTGWIPYHGASPHTDHVHFSFGADGADGKTSFYHWLAGATAPGQGQEPGATVEPASLSATDLMLMAAGAVALVALLWWEFGRERH